MRFLLIALAFTLFLVASASQNDILDYKPKVIACIKSLKGLDDIMSSSVSKLVTTFRLAKNDSMILNNFLESKESNGFGNVDAGFQYATAECKEATLLSLNERRAVQQALKNFFSYADTYTWYLFKMNRLLRNIDADEVESSRIRMKKLVESNYVNFQSFRKNLLKLLPRFEVPEFNNYFERVESHFKSIIEILQQL